MRMPFLRAFYPDKISARIFLLTTILVCFAIIVVATFIEKEGKSLLIQEKSTKLYGITQMLDVLLADTYQKIDPSLSKQKQIEIFSQELTPKVELLLRTIPHVGAGYYHKNLDSIIVYSPSAEYGNNVGHAISDSHKGREVMAEGISLIDVGKQVRGNIMNAMIPIIRDGQILGYIWANESLADIEKQVIVFDKNIIIISLFCMLSCIFIAFILSKKLNSDVDIIKQGLQALSFNLNTTIPAVRGEINEVVNGINSLAMKLQKTKTMNELILENSIDGVITVDNDGLITLMNPAAERMTGHRFVDVIGQPYSVIVDDDNFQSPLLDTLFNGIDHVGVAVDFPVAKHILQISSSTNHLRDHQGRIIGALVIFKDITEQKEVERLMQQTERLVAIGEMMAGIAHEIRNPLASVRGFVQYLQTETSQAEREEYLGIILKEVDSINRVIQQLLDFSAPSKNYYTSVYLSELIQEALQFINLSNQSENIRFHLSLDDTLSMLYVDKELIKQALINLLINAMQAIKGEGLIKITTLLSTSGKYQIIRIKDNGEGIRSELMEKIFTPFFTTKASGTGLGLSMVQKIVASHKGKVTIKNNYNRQGVLVEVSLPVN